ncbi:glycerol-3-phosphate acyltransferase 3 isoform X2 [Chelonus insularis]|uniref:glycerol-3-phosphate acyltransferase 3 isoform X2 n=1 Tax=Chelonus insularis TaxID=460826 RepID=UPI0015897C32|nr:glycerol-3-phosphate acyltransferase 3 isoform X2 [Chelonus insularis]
MSNQEIKSLIWSNISKHDKFNFFFFNWQKFGRLNIEKVRLGNNLGDKKDEDDGGGGNNDSGGGDDNDSTNNSDLSSINEKNNINDSRNHMRNHHDDLGNTVIARSKDLILVPDPETQHYKKNSSNSNSQNKSLNIDNNEKENHTDQSDSHFPTIYTVFETDFCLDYVRAGVEAIIEDQVTSRFEAEELKNWNLLTRTNRRYEFISWKLTIIWMFGFILRYFFLLPLRIFICFFGVMWLTVCTAIVGYVPEGKFKRWLNYKVSIMCFGVLSGALSSVINYHNTKYRPVRGICVANHTSPIDVLVLMCDNCYSLIGQRHGGFLGIFQRALARASPHIWFERSEVKDREAVTRRLKAHISDPSNPPILIFPEGTCINNTSVMQFKKGSFEVGGIIYPVAIKYDPRFGDAFWNSSRYSMVQYLYMMMSSWAIVCDVWYLPPMFRNEGESAIDFANRVKSVIARQGGLVDLQWDGQLKRIKPKKEWREKQQEELSKRLKVD